MVRETFFNDPAVVKLLSTRFVSVALKGGWPDLLAPEDWAFLAKLKNISPTGGCVAVTAGGKELKLSSRPSGTAAIKELQTVLANFQPEDNLVVPPLSAKSQSALPKFPEGSQVLYCTWKVLGGLPEKNHINAKALGIGRFVVTKEEVAALARGQLNESLKRRLFTKPTPFVAGNAKKLELVLREGRLSGAVSHELKKEYTNLFTEFGYEGDVLGFIETKAGKITRFDVVAKGTWWIVTKGANGLGEYTANLGWVPNGEKVTLGVTFTLADPKDPMSRVLPVDILAQPSWVPYLQ